MNDDGFSLISHETSRDCSICIEVGESVIDRINIYAPVWSGSRGKFKFATD